MNGVKKDGKKVSISITIDPKLVKIIFDKFTNKSNYIEDLIYQDLLKDVDNQEKMKNILI